MLEDYFDFLAPDDIRIKGHRIGIETVLYDYVYRGRKPEEIAADYASLALDEVYATILYYLRNREVVGRYLDEYVEYSRRVRDEHHRNPSTSALRLRRLRDELDTYPPEERAAALERMLAREAAEAEHGLAAGA